MRVFSKYGTKERLFEMINKVNKNTLNEEVLSNEQKQKEIDNFIQYINGEIGLNGELPDITISYDDNEASSMKSFGLYTPSTDNLRVVAANRNLADTLRTLAHELIHHKQRKEGILNPASKDTGSEQENEANALAGVLMRNYGKINPIIFE